MRSLFVLGFAVICATVACAKDDNDRDYSAKTSKQAEETAGALRRKIQEEIKTLGSHDWAGEYYHGDGMGVNVSLILAPKAGYVFEWHGCMGLYDRNYGAVTSEKGRLRLSFAFPNKRQGFSGIAEELIPVAWGDRKYLIPSNEIVGFCNEVNDGSEPRKGVHGLYLLRRGDEKKKVNGFLGVPQEFKPYLLAQPIEAQIIGVGASTIRPSVADWKFKDTPVTLNRGKKQGLLVGMKLHVVEPDSIVESVTVTKVEDERSEGIMTQIGEDEKGPRTGWKLSTRCR